MQCTVLTNHTHGGLARTIYTHRIWPYIRWFSCQKYCIYTVYITYTYGSGQPYTYAQKCTTRVTGLQDPILSNYHCQGDCSRTHTHTRVRTHRRTHAHARTRCVHDGLCQPFSVASDAPPLVLLLTAYLMAAALLSLMPMWFARSNATRLAAWSTSRLSCNCRQMKHKCALAAWSTSWLSCNCRQTKNKCKLAAWSTSQLSFNCRQMWHKRPRVFLAVLSFGADNWIKTPRLSCNCRQTAAYTVVLYAGGGFMQ